MANNKLQLGYIKTCQRSDEAIVVAETGLSSILEEMFQFLNFTFTKKFSHKKIFSLIQNYSHYYLLSVYPWFDFFL